MTRRTAARWLAAALTVGAVACARSSSLAPSAADRRLDHLASAVTMLAADPATAALEAAAAGPGDMLESFRFQLWCDALAAADASPEAWRELLAAVPPADVRDRAWRELAGRLVAHGDGDALGALLTSPPSSLQAAADELQVAAGVGPDPTAAARRLAITSPDRLHRLDPALERAVVASLTAEDRIRRGEAWHAVGALNSARAELHGFTAAGATEAARRRALARVEIDAGSVTSALDVVPRGARAGPEDHVVRALAYRARAWSRYPGRSATVAFRDCAMAARAAAEGAGRASEVWLEAQRAALECSTEGGDLARAVEAWTELMGADWHDPRRDWLGRRLGVALAMSRGRAAEEIARSLPDDERCVRYWLASEGDDRGALEGLAAVPVPDLYATWARERLGLSPPSPPALAPAIGSAPPPGAVQWLLAHDRERAAVGEWRRLATLRALTRSEALAAAELTAATGDRFGAIRLLRTAMPSLGGPDLVREPADVVRAYLPLPYPDAVIAAAAEHGLEPWLVAAVARQESAFQPRARSPRDARGLMQLLPTTARGHARALGMIGAPDLDDPVVNLRLGARELAQLVARFGAVEPALAAYNAGPARVARWWARTPQRQRFVEAIPIPETYTYVRRVVFLAEAYHLVYRDHWHSTP